MIIPKQIGWSPVSNSLYEVMKQLDRMTKIGGKWLHINEGILPPTNVVLSPQESSIEITWTTNAIEITGYAFGTSIERSTDELTWTEITRTPSSSYIDNDPTLLPEITYYYRLRSFVGIGWSSYTASQGSLLNPFPVANLVQWFDGTVEGSELVDKSPLALNATITENGIYNSDCESSLGFTQYVAGTISHSTDFAHSGTHSFKHVGTLTTSQGLQTNTFYTTLGRTYRVTFWFYVPSYSGTTTIRCRAINGANAGTSIQTYTLTAQDVGVWKQITYDYTETATGSLGRFVIYSSNNPVTFYVDDIVRVCTSHTEQFLKLAKDSRISENDPNLKFYDAEGFPKPVRLVDVVEQDNDTIFSNISVNKLLVYSQQQNAVYKNKILNWLGGTYTIDDYFTTERTIVPHVDYIHSGFNAIITVGSRLYCFYRHSTGHGAYGTVMRMVYSDDNGATWSDCVDVYDGSDILTDHPDLLIADPLAESDPRDFKTMLLPNGNVGIFGFTAIGHNTDVEEEVRVDLSKVTFMISIPVSGNNLNLESKEIYYVTPYNESNPCSGGIAEKNGVLYVTTYPGHVKLYKSDDNGETWEYVSIVFNVGTHPCNEATLYFINDVMYCVGRDGADNAAGNWVTKSIDFGETWSDYTHLNVGSHGQWSLVTPNNEAIIYGRNNMAAAPNKFISIYRLIGLVNEAAVNIVGQTLSSDIAYGNIALLNGVYYFSYHNGPIRLAGGTLNGTDAGVYYKAIVASRINDF